jgi:hypothetical protein
VNKKALIFQRFFIMRGIRKSVAGFQAVFERHSTFGVRRDPVIFSPPSRRIRLKAC